MMKCDCGRECRDQWAYSRNKLFNDVCSRYCSIRRTNGESHDPKRTYQIACSVCDNQFTLKYPYNHANQMYCSSSCISTISSVGRAARRNHMLLMALYLHPEGLTSQDLFDFAERNVFRIKDVRGVSIMLRQWVRKGFVSVSKTEGLRLYRWNTELRPGQAILRGKQ
jgi:hypothetical protein